jgi:flagellar motor switch protein FliG
MSERQAAMIREDLDALGGVKLRDVERCQADIVREAKRMEEEGRITIGGRGEGDVIV